eukprot:g16312.t1
MSGECAPPPFADLPQEQQQEEEEVKPSTCALCPYVTQSDEDMRMHRMSHAQPQLLPAPGPIKREAPIEWWAPCDGETSEGSDGGLCPRGGTYAWENPGRERPWLFEESPDGGTAEGQAGMGGEVAAEEEEEEEEDEEDANY